VMSLRSGVNGRRDSVMWRSRRRVANAGGTAAGQVDDPHRARCESLANRIVAGLLLPRRRAFRDQDILLLAAAIRTVGRDDWGEPADPAAHCGATAAWSRAAKIASRGSQSRCVRSRQDLRRRAAAIGDTPLNHGSGGCAPWHVAEPWVGPPRSVTRRWTMGRAAALPWRVAEPWVGPRRSWRAAELRDGLPAALRDVSLNPWVGPFRSERYRCIRSGRWTT
jgi:hypothetical protein